MSGLRYVVIEFRNPFEVRAVSRHKTSGAARRSADKHGLNVELNVLELHPGDVPGVGDTMPRAELKERFRPVPSNK